MNLLSVFAIAVGLAMDAFAVSVSAGLRMTEVSRWQTVRISLHFGGFQAAMPVVGWLLGSSLRVHIQTCDHWVAFAILMVLGVKMIVDSLWPRRQTQEGCGPLKHAELLLLSVATSIDALAVGVSIAMLRFEIWTPAIVTGIVTGVLSAVGLDLGDRIGARAGRIAEVFGGLILCGIGIKILVRHLLAGPLPAA